MDPVAQARFKTLASTCHDYAEQLVAVCDGALTKDQRGFSKSHVQLGRVMAFTAPEAWTLQLLKESVACLRSYSATQLSGARAVLDDAQAALKEWEDAKLAPGKTGHIRPKLGVETTADGKTVVTVLSIGHGDPEHEKKLKKHLKLVGAEFDSALGTYRLPAYSEITTEFGAKLRELVAMADPRADAKTSIEAILAAAKPTTMLIRMDPHPDHKGTMLLTLPARTLKTSRDPIQNSIFTTIYGALPNSRRAFDTYNRNWVITLSPKDVDSFREWTRKHYLHLANGVEDHLRELAAVAPVVHVPPAQRMVSVTDSDKAWIAVLVPKYNPDFNAWLKASCPGCQFRKDPPLGPRWLVKPEHAHALAGLEKGLLSHKVAPYHIPPDVSRTIVESAEAEKIEELRRQVLSKASATLNSTFEVRPGLTGVLRPFQGACVAYSAVAMQPNKGILIGDEMGLGKTIEAIAIAHHHNLFPLIVVAPGGMLRAWRDEIQKWLPASPKIQLIDSRTPVKPDSATSIYLVSEGVMRNQVEALSSINPKGIVIDEIHHFVNSQAQRTQALEVLASKIPMRMAISGTPQKNQNSDLIAPLRILGRLDDLGGFWNYAHRYCGANQDTLTGRWDFSNNTNSDELNKILRETCMIRRLKQEVAPELPPKIYTILETPITNRAEYQQALTNLYDYLISSHYDDPGTAISGHQLTLISTLRSVTGRGKIQAALDFTERTSREGQKLVVYAHHQDVIDGFRAMAPDTPVIDGSAPMAARHAYAKAFQEDPNCNLIVISDAGALGITLTAASSILLIEPHWTPADMDQTVDRIHRIGQTASAVNVYRMYAPNTIDSKMFEIEAGKRENFEVALNGERSNPTEARSQESVMASMMSDFIKEAKAYQATKKRTATAVATAPKTAASLPMEIPIPEMGDTQTQSSAMRLVG